MTILDSFLDSFLLMEDLTFALKGQFKQHKVMAQSLSKLFVHIIFRIKASSTKIREEDYT